VSSPGEQNDEEGDSSRGVSVVLDILGAKLLVEGGGPSEGSSSSSWIPLGVGRLRLLSRGDEAADELTFDSTSSNVSLRHFLFGWSSVGGENGDLATGGGGSGDAPSIVSWNAAVALEDPLNAVPEVRNFRLAPNTHEDAYELYQALLSVSSIVIHLILFLKIVHRVYELFHNCNLYRAWRRRKASPW
jgi:hypothetical protein